MRTISQVAELTGISTRTLQYYDEIGLLKPSELTESGYRLYDDEALQKLQQILFFKELGFKLKEIGKQSDILYGRLTADLSEDVSSSKIQSIVQEIWLFI